MSYGTSLWVKARAEEVILGELHCSIDLLYFSQLKPPLQTKNKVLCSTKMRLYFALDLIFCKKPKSSKSHTPQKKWQILVIYCYSSIVSPLFSFNLFSISSKKSHIRFPTYFPFILMMWCFMHGSALQQRLYLLVQFWLLFRYNLTLLHIQ